VKLRFSPRARDNLLEIADYLRERNPRAALRVRSAILASLQIITRYPSAGRGQTTERVRKLVVRKYPYLIYYTLRDNEIIVLSIKHAAQRREHQDS
jgi:toxin ParE1/3/4